MEEVIEDKGSFELREVFVEKIRKGLDGKELWMSSSGSVK